MFTTRIKIADRKWLLIRVWLDGRCTWDAWQSWELKYEGWEGDFLLWSEN